MISTAIHRCSSAILAWAIWPAMRERDAEIVIQNAHEANPKAKPRIICRHF